MSVTGGQRDAVSIELRCGHGGQPDGERRSAGVAIAGRVNAAAMHLGEALHQRQADSQPTARAIDGVMRLDEQVEDLRQHLGGNTDA